MPELPEVEIIRRGLKQVTLGQQIIGGEVLLERTIAHPLTGSKFLEGITGGVILDWQRRGKYLLARLDQAPQRCSQNSQGSWLGVHLRMTGQLLWLDQADESLPPSKYTRVRIYFANAAELRFVDLRTFGQMWWIPPACSPEAIIVGLQRLGPEPLAADFSVEYLAQALSTQKRPIKNALLDQTLVAGIGNIYADEALFLSGVRPTTLANRVPSNQVRQLHRAMTQVLRTGIEAGGTTFSSFHNLQGINGNYGGIAWVYGRERQPCRTCGTPIQRLKLAGRSAHFCPECQR